MPATLNAAQPPLEIDVRPVVPRGKRDGCRLRRRGRGQERTPSDTSAAVRLGLRTIQPAASCPASTILRGCGPANSEAAGTWYRQPYAVHRLLHELLARPTLPELEIYHLLDDEEIGIVVLLAGTATTYSPGNELI